VLVCGPPRVCNHVDVHTQRYSAEFPRGSAHARSRARDGGASGRIGPGPRQALWRAAARSVSGQHICKYVGIYVYILLVAGTPTIIQFQVRTNALAHGGEILPGYPS